MPAMLVALVPAFKRNGGGRAGLRGAVISALRRRIAGRITAAPAGRAAAGQRRADQMKRQRSGSPLEPAADLHPETAWVPAS